MGKNWIVYGCLLMALTMGSAQETPTPPEQEAAVLRARLDKWIEANRLAAQAEAEWASEKQTLQRRIAVLEQENKLLDQRIAEAQATTSEAEKKRAALLEKRDTLQATAAVIAQNIAFYERELRALVPLLPAPLQREVAPLLAKIPAQTSERPISERTQTVLTLLEAVEKFDNSVTLVSEVREVPGQGQREVQVLYLGLAQGYFIDASGTVAGVLRPAEDQWFAEIVPDLAEPVSRAIAVYETTRQAELVDLPLTLEHTQ